MVVYDLFSVIHAAVVLTGGSLFFPYLIRITLYFYVSSTVQQKNQITDFLYVYLCIVLREAHVLKGSS